ncbi:hypothetical protein BN440_0081 [Erwinia amylovora MR1]|nr:hypothetical protein BN440_0081 [Erwinia amylovora MR1]
MRISYQESACFTFTPHLCPCYFHPTSRPSGRDGEKALQLATRAGEMRFHLDGSRYTATIGGRALPLRITSTRARYGVRRCYLCPCCHNRAATLLIGKRDLACRKCLGLHYASQSEDGSARMRRGLFKQRAAIWGNYAPAQSLFNDCALIP